MHNMISGSHDHHSMHYKHLAIMGVIHLVIMYAVMYSMVYSWSEVFNNLNMFYMAIMMATPMIALMPLMMGSMYPDKKKNIIIYAASLILFFGAFVFIRQQSLIGDQQFIASMTPHHSGAVLMCERTELKDPELKALCERIISSQKEEIEQMKEIKKRL